MKRTLMGIDVGTSSVKVIVIDESGALLSSATQEYPLSIPRATWSEQNPEDWFTGTLAAIKTALTESGADASSIAGVGFSGQMHGLVALDANNAVIRPAILWNDQRTGEECAEIIAAAGGPEGLLGYTNNTMLPGYTGGKLLWVKKHEPENYKKITKFLMPKDYMRYRMTGELATDASEASGTGLYDVQKRGWSWGLIDLLGFDRSLFVKVYESDEVAGKVTAEFAKLSGLIEGTPVFAGGGDAVIQNAGMGIVSEGTVGAIIGTSGVVAMALTAFGTNAGSALQYFCGNAAGTYMAFGCQLSSGGSMEWFKDNFYEGADPFKAINEQAANSPVGAKNLYFLPYLTGERCPYADPDARGAFLGMTLLHNKGDFARAVMEGVTFGLKQIYNLIAAAKPDLVPKEVISSGGGSKSALWRQIQADIFGLPVKTLKGGAEGGAFGAALVAGVGAGLWKNLAQACGVLQEETLTQPIPANVEAYKKAFAVYDSLYGDLKNTFKKLGEGN